jgi:hypothetical protein
MEGKDAVFCLIRYPSKPQQIYTFYNRCHCVNESNETEYSAWLLKYKPQILTGLCHRLYVW